MPYDPFQKLCKYFLDYIIEDGTDSLSAFASGNRLSYMEIINPELSSRENNSFQDVERNEFSKPGE